jgi:hypothetical protein
LREKVDGTGPAPTCADSFGSPGVAASLPTTLPAPSPVSVLRRFAPRLPSRPGENDVDDSDVVPSAAWAATTTGSADDAAAALPSAESREKECPEEP